MEEVKSKLNYLKTKILQYKEIPDNIRLELSNDIFKVEQALNIHSVSQQRELLIGLLTRLEKDGGNEWIEKDYIVNKYLANL